MFDVLLCTALVLTGNQDTRDFATLPAARQKEVLLAGVKQRRARLSNFHGTVRVLQYVSPRPSNGVINGERLNVQTYEQEVRQIDDSLWLSNKYWNPDTDTPLFHAITAYYADSGAWKSLAFHSQIEAPQGIINKGRDAASQRNFLCMYFGRSYAPGCFSDSDFLLNNAEFMTITSFDQASQQVNVLVSPPRQTGRHESRAFLIAIDQGFMILQGSRTISIAKKVVEHNFVAKDTRSSDDGTVYPVRIQNVVTSTTQPDIATVYDIEIGMLKIGTLTPDDLVIGFPVGTQVNDRTKQEFYIAGREEDRINYAGKPHMVVPSRMTGKPTRGGEKGSGALDDPERPPLAPPAAGGEP